MAQAHPCQHLANGYSQHIAYAHPFPAIQVFQGVLFGATDRFDKAVGAGAVFGGNVASPPAYLLALWAHESERTFCDKMITLPDKAWVEGAIRDLCR